MGAFARGWTKRREQEVLKLQKTGNCGSTLRGDLHDESSFKPPRHRKITDSAQNMLKFSTPNLNYAQTN